MQKIACLRSRLTWDREKQTCYIKCVGPDLRYHAELKRCVTKTRVAGKRQILQIMLDIKGNTSKDVSSSECR